MHAPKLLAFLVVHRASKKRWNREELELVGAVSEADRRRVWQRIKDKRVRNTGQQRYPSRSCGLPGQSHPGCHHSLSHGQPSPTTNSITTEGKWDKVLGSRKKKNPFSNVCGGTTGGVGPVRHVGG